MSISGNLERLWSRHAVEGWPDPRQRAASQQRYPPRSAEIHRHAQRWRALRDLPAAASPPHPGSVGVPLHPQARQLAQSSRDRDQRLRAWLPFPPCGGHDDFCSSA